MIEEEQVYPAIVQHHRLPTKEDVGQEELGGGACRARLEEERTVTIFSQRGELCDIPRRTRESRGGPCQTAC